MEPHRLEARSWRQLSGAFVPMQSSEPQESDSGVKAAGWWPGDGRQSWQAWGV